MIDAMYEGKVVVVMQSEASVTQLLNISEEEKSLAQFDEVSYRNSKNLLN